MKKSKRILLARETLRILETGMYRADNGLPVSIEGQISTALQNLRLYHPDDFPEQIPTNIPGVIEARIEVTEETTLEAAARLAGKSAQNDPLCLNFASAKNPGGGFLNGSQAQEESLARSSALYATLIRMPEMYDHNRHLGTSLYSDYMWYSPAVPIFRDDEGSLLAAPHSVSFITAPAVNAGAVRRNEPHNIPLIRPTLDRRLERLLWIAREHHHRTLILGAWGCGVFRNDPVMIAELFAEAFGPEGKFRDGFERIVFAVFDRSEERKVLGAFRKVLDNSFA